MLRNQMKCYVVAGLSVALGILVSGCTQSSEETASAPPPNQNGSGERMGRPGGGMQPVAANATGAEIFQQKCQRCHGEKGEGKVGPNLTKLDDTDVQLHTIIHDGHEKMPAFAQQLSDAQIDLVIAHLRTLAVK